MPSRLFKELMQPLGWDRLPGIMAEPLVTFLMPTFGRAARQPSVIGEVVYWYMQQTYRHRELLIVNDAPNQTVGIDPDLAREYQVRVYNLPMRSPSLGDKMNLLVTLARGSVCLVQEDDDVSLPWRAEQAVRGLAEHDYFAPGLWWYAEEGKPMVADGRGVGHNCSAYRRYAMFSRYAGVTKGHDAKAHDWAMKNLKVNPVRLCPTEDLDQISYVYRFGVSDLHLGAQPDMEAAYQSADPGPPGFHVIVPAMERDYVQLHKEACERWHTQNSTSS